MVACQVVISNGTEEPCEKPVHERRERTCTVRCFPDIFMSQLVVPFLHWSTVSACYQMTLCWCTTPTLAKAARLEAGTIHRRGGF